MARPYNITIQKGGKFYRMEVQPLRCTDECRRYSVSGKTKMMYIEKEKDKEWKITHALGFEEEPDEETFKKITFQIDLYESPSKDLLDHLRKMKRY